MPTLAADTAPVAVYVELDGALDRDTLTAALNDVVARFGATPVSGDTAPTITLDTLDLSGQDRPRAAALRWMESFDHVVAGAPAIAGHLIDIGAGVQILHLSGRPTAADGSAGATLLHHLAVAYSARVHGRVETPRRVAPPRHRTGRDVAAADIGFWDTDLDPVPAATSLSHRPHPAASTAGSPSVLTESRTMSVSASDALRSAAAVAGTRVETVVVAAVAGYIAGLCRSDEVLIGLPAIVAPESDHVPTATTLPLRLTTTSHTTVADAVAATDARIAAVLAHSAGWPAHPLRDHLASAPAGQGPVVNVIPFLGPVRFADVDGDVFVLCGGPVDDLRVNVYDARERRIRVDLEAHPDRYLRTELRAHHARFLDYLSRFVAASATTRLATLDVISVAEHIEVVDEPNATDVLMPPATVTELIEMGMARDHDHAAVTGDGAPVDALSHGELDCRANQLTRVLLAAGVGPESVVGVMTADHVAGITAMLAVLRAGGAVLPLDPTDPATTIAHRIARARPTCVVTDRVLDDVALDPDDAARPAEPTSATGYDAIPPWVEAIPFDAAELDEVPDDPISPSELHSPGHLGNPVWIAFGDDADGDGVVLTHRAVANRLQWLQAHRSPTATEQMCVGDGRFDDRLWNSLLPLIVGATIDLTCAPVAESVLSGPAEAAFGVLPGHTGDGASDPTAGRPVWNSAVYVLDAFLRPLPVGAVGEVYVAGDQVARGYASDPAATSDRFVANPFRPGTRMVRTGVAAFRRPDGSIEHVVTDRVSSQVVVEASVPTTPRTLAEMVAVVASADPDAVAATVDDGADRMSITFRELDQRSNQWARLLMACDVGPEDVVAVALPRGLDALIAIWAVVKSGAAFVTVDPRTVADHGAADPVVHQVLTDSRVRFGFVTAATTQDMPGAPGAVRWMSIDGTGYRTVVACLSVRPIRDTARHARLDLDHLAYVAYSAADGAPVRAVAVSNRVLSMVADEQRKRCGVDQCSRMLHATSGDGPIPVLEVLLAISTGARMIIATDAARDRADDLVRVLRGDAVTHAFLDVAMAESLSPNGLPDLRVLVAGQGRSTPELIDRWTAPDRRVLGALGDSDASTGLVVLDRDLREVTAGTPGELYVTGPALARGFLGSAALTATRFVANPAHLGTDRAGSILYRTGDIVTMSPDGHLTYLGRSDSFA
ncbi:AMP-binding protein [Williamsia maris]|uniref:Non-ribosomal peptide synthetase component F n=1 Tax=Williamsia maris TaxID=72806 RepID=A0ABT1HAC9_9NOCA|nr:AMP-binding protein [Williamsia maris]MCP2174695.1 Non-ribosomal peptide synthetase component F [Williamsia maris]